MASHPPSLGDTFATIRAGLQGDSVSTQAAGALSQVMTALLLRLLLELEQMVRRWEARSPSHAAAPRLTRYAGLPFVPRALRQPPLPTWLVSLAPNRGMRPAGKPRPQSRTRRQHPVRNAPH